MDPNIQFKVGNHAMSGTLKTMYATVYISKMSITEGREKWESDKTETSS